MFDYDLGGSDGGTGDGIRVLAYLAAAYWVLFVLPAMARTGWEGVLGWWERRSMTPEEREAWRVMMRDYYRAQRNAPPDDPTA